MNASLNIDPLEEQLAYLTDKCKTRMEEEFKKFFESEKIKKGQWRFWPYPRKQKEDETREEFHSRRWEALSGTFTNDMAPWDYRFWRDTTRDIFSIYMKVTSAKRLGATTVLLDSDDIRTIDYCQNHWLNKK